MNKQEFETYLNEHCSALSKFQARALDYQANKNQNRTKSARWNDAKVQRAADAMYDTFLDGIYTKLRNAIKNILRLSFHSKKSQLSRHQH